MKKNFTLERTYKKEGSLLPVGTQSLVSTADTAEKAKAEFDAVPKLPIEHSEITEEFSEQHYLPDNTEPREDSFEKFKELFAPFIASHTELQELKLANEKRKAQLLEIAVKKAQEGQTLNGLHIQI